MPGKMWLKRVLIPFWTIEMAWLLAVIVLGALNLYVVETDASNSDSNSNGQAYQVLSIASIIVLTIGTLSLIFDITIIVLFARHKLNPVPFLVLSSVKALFWIVIFVLDIVASAGDANEVSGFLFSAVLFATSVGQLIYGAVIMSRSRKGVYTRGNYAGVETGYRGAGNASPPRGSYAGYNPHGAPPNPFRDPSRGPSPSAAQREPLVTEPAGPSHPAFRKSGEAESYYNNEPPQNSFEMHNPATAYRDS
ncbi:hypothetical protein LTR91_025287 [Friedmanniomyces endolithicus]|uniref:MARVEL domain-containing protein n=1 Tax=Friedmanniomyces endolithicus TaxID=329885 RepID=A0A4U0UWN0_9PEZI|nr:hypothetical protein LTS09_003912 [Friedmanniomyces endolithicus]KAK0307153.1 hypothetical protein LTR01_005799 [Friedmanniomyces endolithicus]KAK0833927.1 hypothetical protein LTR73_001690 [Friedmanniomyces endolithicus]KAK0950980.1 hypothetical protein LTR91_025287 [Friedmanniomyces endolithicus]KAK1052187.1 hypothetical protein LTS16_001866 [Friedmanniomyces endolithicus]